MNAAAAAVMVCTALILVIFAVLSLLGHQIHITEPEPAQVDPEADLAQVAADDELLDRLGRGGPANPDDELETLLAAFRRQCDAPTEPGLEPVDAP